MGRPCSELTKPGFLRYPVFLTPPCRPVIGLCLTRLRREAVWNSMHLLLHCNKKRCKEPARHVQTQPYGRTNRHSFKFHEEAVSTRFFTRYFSCLKICLISLHEMLATIEILEISLKNHARNKTPTKTNKNQQKPNTRNQQKPTETIESEATETSGSSEAQDERQDFARSGFSGVPWVFPKMGGLEGEEKQLGGWNSVCLVCFVFFCFACWLGIWATVSLGFFELALSKPLVVCLLRKNPSRNLCGIFCFLVEMIWKD